MPHTVTVTARRTFEFGGRVYASGDALDLEPVQAAILRDRGCIALASDRPVVARRQVATPARTSELAATVDAVATPPLVDDAEPMTDEAAPAVRPPTRAERRASRLRQAAEGASAS